MTSKTSRTSYRNEKYQQKIKQEEHSPGTSHTDSPLNPSFEDLSRMGRTLKDRDIATTTTSRNSGLLVHHITRMTSRRIHIKFRYQNTCIRNQKPNNSMHL